MIEQIGIGVSYIIIGGNGTRVIVEMLFPGSDCFRIVLRQVVALALREGDGPHHGGVGLQQFGGQMEIAQALVVSLGIDTYHTEAIGTARMLHL